MRPFQIPPQNKGLVRVLFGTVLVSPIIVALHFSIRLLNGDYGLADAIAIPIFHYLIFVLPLSVLLLRSGLRRYATGAFLFAWNQNRFWRSLGWSVLSLYPLLWAIGMVLDGIHGGLYGVSAFFVLKIYCLLVLRAAVVGEG